MTLPKIMRLKRRKMLGEPMPSAGIGPIKQDEFEEIYHALSARRAELMWLLTQEGWQPYAVRHLSLVHRLLRKRTLPTRS